ncbi:MAG: SDR family oxidoreductase [Reyranella sp.]|nr:SDR family oxidoreductase [Reyranella sp.]
MTAGWVVVSGAAGALGSAIAGHFMASGRKVLALDLKPPEINLTVAWTLDLTDYQAVQTALGAINDAEPITLLVNAVGQIWSEPVLAFKDGRFATHDTATLRMVVDANLIAPFVTATAVAARMVRSQGGVIVNFSSIAASGNAGQAAYSATKAGIEGMTRAMAAELGPLGVRINAVAPGFIDVPTTHAAISNKQLGQYRLRTPLGRLGMLDELIAAIEFLEKNKFITGQILRIDGGLRL